MRSKGARNARFDERRAELLARLKARLCQRDGMRPTLRELAMAAGCSVSTLNHYFGRRDDIVLAVFADSGRRGQVQFEATRIPAADFETSVREAAATSWTALTRHGVAGALAMGMVEGMRNDRLGPAFIKTMFEPFVIALTQRFDAHVARGEMRVVDTRMAALALASPLVLAALHQGELGGALSIRSTATASLIMWSRASCAPIVPNEPRGTGGAAWAISASASPSIWRS